MADLLADYGEHRKTDRQHVVDQAARENDTTVSWRVAHLDLAELTESVAQWFTRAAVADRYALLLKLSTAAALAASAHLERPPTRGSGPQTRIDDLAGVWLSRYQYASSGRAGVFEDFHRVLLRAQDGRLLGRSLPQDDGSELELKWLPTIPSCWGAARNAPRHPATTEPRLTTGCCTWWWTRRAGRCTGNGSVWENRFAIKSGQWSFTWERPATESEATGL